MDLEQQMLSMQLGATAAGFVDVGQQAAPDGPEEASSEHPKNPSEPETTVHKKAAKQEKKAAKQEKKAAKQEKKAAKQEKKTAKQERKEKKATKQERKAAKHEQNESESESDSEVEAPKTVKATATEPPAVAQPSEERKFFYGSRPAQPCAPLPGSIGDKLRQLHEMGFLDKTENLAVIQKAHGEVHRAIDLLLWETANAE
jgi:outer membrane biosynthesis protein TonB